MYISTKASRIRQNEAERARKNRAEIVKARSIGQVSRRDLIKWGVFTANGLTDTCLTSAHRVSLLANRAIAGLETPMDEDSRRPLHRLIVRAADKDAQATAAMEEMIMGLDRSGSADDVAQSLQMILTIGGEELHKRIVTRLQENDQQQRQQWPMIAQP